MKRSFTTLLLLLVLIAVIPSSVLANSTLKPDSSIKVYIDGMPISFDVEPIVMNGTTLVQFTPIFNTLGIGYEWISETQEINGVKNGKTISLHINNPVVTVNDFNIKLSATPILYNSRTMVPLRFVSEATGMDVVWKSETKEIWISEAKNPPSYNRPDFTVFTDGVDFSMDETELFKKISTVPDMFLSNVYSYFDYKKFGYLGTFSVLFGNDDKRVTSLSYEYASSELPKSVLSVYRDMVAQLEDEFGPAKQSHIMQRTELAYTALKNSISDQELIRGLRNGSLDVINEWQLSNVSVTAYLLHDGVKVIILISFTEPI